MIPAAAGTDNPYLGEFLKLVPLLDPAGWQNEETPERQWVLQEWIPAKQTTYLTGPGSAGKSLLAQLLCTCIALGRPFMGVPTRQAVAIYITCEDDADELHRRQKAICAALGIPLAALSGKLHLVSLIGKTANELATFNQGVRAIDDFGGSEPILRPTKLYWAIEGIAHETQAGFIGLDNVAHLFGGNENIRVEVAAFISLLNRLALTTAGAVLLIGHPNKAGAEYSGSTAWTNQVRSRLYLEAPAGEDGSVIDPDVRVLSRGKANYARNGEELQFRWHKWTFVQDEELPSEFREEHAAILQASHDNEIFLSCLDVRNGQERPVSESKASRTYAPKEFADMAESKRIGRPRLEAAMDRLFRLSAIERGFIYRDAGEGKDRFGLRRTSADVTADHPLTPSADVPLTTRRPPPAHTLISKDITGAPLGAAAPVAEGENDPSAPPQIGGVERGGANEASGCSTTTPTPKGVVGWSSLPTAVEQTGPGSVEHGPAVSLNASRSAGPILAPGDEEDEPFSRPPISSFGSNL